MTPHSEPSCLFDSYGAMVYRRCRQILGTDDLAADAVQEVFLRAITARTAFRAQCAPSTWLYRIATTHCLQVLRNRHARAAKLERLATERAAAGPRQEPWPEDRLAVRELMEIADERAFQIAFLHHVEGMTLEEVAEVTGYSRKTVAKKLGQLEQRARKRLHDNENGR